MFECSSFSHRLRTSGPSPILLIHAQHLAQQHDRIQQIVVMDDPPLAEVVAGVERPVPIFVGILCPPRSAVDLADRAHGIQGFADDAVGHAGPDTWNAASRMDQPPE